MNQEEMQELEALREEKRARLQRERAEQALQEAGIPAAFAPLLAGADDGDTDQRTGCFCAAYQKAMSEGIRERLPQSAPQMTPPSATPRPRRGIQRLR